MTSVHANEILAGGEASIEQMIHERREETLHLEFKCLSSASGFNRDDRKLIAKAITGFCNAEGGILIVGIETTRIDGIDVATKTRPIAELERIHNLIKAAVPEMLSPQHYGITVERISISSAPDRGFIIIAVPESDNRPHMDILEQRYFRRGGDGTRVLVHQEIRELMLAGRVGALEIRCGMIPGASMGDLRFDIKLALILCNTGRVPVVAPYVHIDGGGWGMVPAQIPLTTRFNGKRQGVYGSRDILIHLDDEMPIAQRETGLDFRGTGQTVISGAVELIKKSQALHVFRMAPWGQIMNTFGAIPDVSIKVSGSFGAENAVAKRFEFDIDKRALLNIFCEYHSLPIPLEGGK